ATPARELPQMLDVTGIGADHDRGYRPALPVAVEAAVFPANGTTVTLWTFLAFLTGAAACLARLLDRRALAALTLLAAVLPLAIVVWDGEPSEIPRHGLLVSVTARLGLLLLVAIVVDRGAERARRRPALAGGRIPRRLADPALQT